MTLLSSSLYLQGSTKSLTYTKQRNTLPRSPPLFYCPASFYCPAPLPLFFCPTSLHPNAFSLSVSVILSLSISHSLPLMQFYSFFSSTSPLCYHFSYSVHSYAASRFSILPAPLTLPYLPLFLPPFLFSLFVLL